MAALLAELEALFSDLASLDRRVSSLEAAA